MSAPSTPLDAEALLVHGPFLRALARSLLGDAARADDVVQQTYVKALEQPPREAGSLRAWLATVARNLAREGGRREGRRRRWERGAARSEALPSTAEIVEREAVRRQVVEAVLALEPLYRDVILLRFYEDLPPRRIAAELDLPVETVRTRIRRGLSQLEGSLDRRHGGDRRRWLAALAPLALSRSASAGIGGWLAHALASLGPATQVVVLALALVAVTAVSLWWLDEPAPIEPPPARQVADAGDASQPAVARQAGLATHGEDDLAASASAPERLAAPVPPFLTGRLFDADGAPLAHAEVLVVGAAFDDVSQLTQAGRGELAEAWRESRVPTDREGRWTADDLGLGVWVVATPGTAERPFAAAGAVLVGVPPHLALIASNLVRQRCEEAGLPPLAFHILDLGGSLELDLQAAAPAPRPMLVIDERGRPVADARVTVGSPDARLALESGPYRSWLWTRLEPLLPVLTSAADGRLQAPLQRDGLLVVRADGYAPQVVELDEATLLAPRLEIVLPRVLELDIAGQVRDGEGAPVPGARVALDEFFFGGTLLSMEVRRVDQRLRHVTTADGRGRFRFDAVELLTDDPWRPAALRDGGSVMVNAGAEGFLNGWQQLRLDGAGDRLDAEVVLQRGGPLELTLIDRATLAPLTDAFVNVRYTGISGTTTTSGSELDGDGMLWQADVRHGPLSLEVRRLGHEPFQHELADWRGEPLELLVDLTPVDWLVEVTLRDASGTPVEGSVVSHRLGGSEHDVGHQVLAFDHDPRARFAAGFRGGLQASSAQLGQQVAGGWRDGRLLLPLGETFDADEAWVAVLRFGRLLAVAPVLRGQTRLDLPVPGLTQGLTPGAALGLLELVVEEGDDSGFLIGIEVLDAHTGDRVARLDTSWTEPTLSGVVPAGRYDLVAVSLLGYRHVWPDVTVAAGTEPTRLALSLPDGAELSVSLRTPDGAPAEGQAWVHDAAGRTLAHATVSDGLARFPQLSPGRQRLTLLGERAGLVHELALDSGDQLSLDLTLQPATTLTLDCQQPGALVIVRDALGRCLHEGLLARGDRRTLALGDGRFRVDVAGHGEQASHHELLLAGDDQTLVLR